MTEEYKDVLLKYLTGTINEEETPANITGHFEEPDVITNGLKTYMDNAFSNYTITGVLQSESYETCIVYGTYRTGEEFIYYGFLLITDSNFNPIQLITEYDSGTSLQYFKRLELDEKNQIYGIDYNNESSKSRFIMLNNVFANGVAKLRQSYNLPNNMSDMTGFRLTKNPNSADYLIAGTVFQGNIYQPLVVKLTVNVGSENEWVYYNYSGTLLGAESALSNLYADWTNDNVQFRITAFSESQFLVYSSWYYNDSTLIDVELYDIGNNWITTTIYSSSSIVADIDTYYYGVYADVDGQELMALYMIDNGEQSLINMQYVDTTSDYSGNIRLNIKNGALFYIMTVPNNSKTNIIAGIYKNNKINMSTFIAQEVQFNGYQVNNIINNFNLYKFNLQDSNTLYSIKSLYNSTINFGNHTAGYNNYQDLKPLSMSLFENNELIFNRNLYNLVINGSTATATVEVPNTMLNSNTIDEENLIGNHYLQIANNTEEITTNEYETLHINSINTLSMINLDTGVLNPQGSSRLNNSTNLTQDYNSAIANKVCINYSDDTNYTFELGKSQITESNGVYTYTFVVYISKPINNIEIISNDEATTYQIITGTFEVGKYYQITQEVTI